MTLSPRLIRAGGGLCRLDPVPQPFSDGEGLAVEDGDGLALALLVSLAMPCPACPAACYGARVPRGRDVDGRWLGVADTLAE